MNGVAIAGVGVVSPAGNSLADLTDAIRQGPLPGRGTAPGGMCDIPLHVIPSDARTRIGRLDRLCRLFLAASYLAVDDTSLDLTAIDPERLALSFGTGLGCLLTNAEYYDRIVEQGVAAASPRLFAYTVSSAAAGEVSIALGITGPNVTHHAGLAGGLAAIGYGFDLIASGRADVAVAGGADANGEAIGEGLRDMRLLKTQAQSRPFLDSIPGIWPSEGAGVFVLAGEATARAAGARIRGRVLGYAAGFEPTLASAAPSARGVRETMQRALARSGVAADDVGLVVCSAHGTPVDTAERAAIAEVLGEGTVVLAPKAVLGEAFAASGVLGLASSLGLEGGFTLPPGDRSPAFFSTAGDALDPRQAASRARDGSVVMVNALCYSGNVVSLLCRRE
jgi:3-oxoacyl-[acyl-carrier-protein] synthase II